MPSIVFKMPLHRNNTQMSKPGAAITQRIGVVLKRTVDLATTIYNLPRTLTQVYLRLVIKQYRHLSLSDNHNKNIKFESALKTNHLF